MVMSIAHALSRVVSRTRTDGADRPRRPSVAPLCSRERSYREQYVAAFVEKWDELIDWDRRAAAEGTFFLDVLRSYGVSRVLDVATGTGFHSVRLKQAGFDVTSVDGCETMLAKAAENGLRHGHPLDVVHADWRWLGRRLQGRFDAVICLGNSFTHLFDEFDRRRALAEYYSMLDDDGILILDQRNYDALLDRRARPGRRYYYCGVNVSARPVHVDESVARFVYEFAGGSTFHLDMFPLRKDYVRRLVCEAGFRRIATYGDFKETYREAEPDFFVHVAEKTYRAGEPA